MKQEHLADLIERPETHRMILGDYKGSYSLGLTLNPSNRSQLAIRVRIEGNDVSRLPKQVLLEGEVVPVVVIANFITPTPLRANK